MHFRSILRPSMPTNYIFQPKTNLLEMAHTNFFSSIRKTPYQPLVWLEDNEKTCFRIPPTNDIFQKNTNTYFQICSCIQKTTLNLIETLKTKFIIQNRPNIFKYMFNTPPFSKIFKCWAPLASPRSSWANKLICLREKIRPMRLH